jgi:hypothetical protein
MFQLCLLFEEQAQLYNWASTKVNAFDPTERVEAPSHLFARPTPSSTNVFEGTISKSCLPRLSCRSLSSCQYWSFQMNHHLTFQDALGIAVGCHDYQGGYSDNKEREVFHHGIQTVVQALQGAAINGLADQQVRVLLDIGRAQQASQRRLLESGK